MKIHSLFSGIKSSAKMLKNIGKHRGLIFLILLFVIGLLLISSATFILTGVPLIVCLFVGSILILLSWGKMIFDRAVKQAISLNEAQKITEENEKLKRIALKFQQELKRTKNKKLQVLNVQPILELGLFEAECLIRECYDLVLDKNREIVSWNDSLNPDVEYKESLGDWVWGDLPRRFIGTLTAKFTARYGIDMQSLKVRVDDVNKTVLVRGAEPAFLGSKGFPETCWEGVVSLRQQRDDTWISDEGSQAIESDCKDFCRSVMEEDLKDGPAELEWLKSPLQKTVKNLMEMMITPEGFTVEFVEGDDNRFLPFFEYTASLGMERPKLTS